MVEYQSSVSIIIPLRNEKKYITRCLDKVLAQDYPPELIEIICVDGLSDDGTRQMLETYAARHGRFKILDNPQRIVPTAMNLGIRASSGQIIIRVDARSFIAPDYVSKIVYHLQRTQAAGVGG
ncbi:MAG: glycosyltransferase, partial [Anaerolineae bacterium]|nr:glycosyltransferase [Anaerolineae bacterium]